MRAGVHHHDAVPGQEQYACVLKDTHAIVRHAVIDQNPVPIRACGAHLPAAQEHGVGRAHVERFTVHAYLFKSDVCFANQVRRKLAPDRVQERRSGQPAADSRKGWRKEQDYQQDANRASHSHSPR